MMPHSRKDAKFDSKSKLYQLNELAELYNCNNVLFFEARKGQDLYMWASKVPNGPTVKMHVQNCKQHVHSDALLVHCARGGGIRQRADSKFYTVHTMEELHFTGNCLKGSRPVLSFDAAFDKEPHLMVIKELFYHIFGVPQGARKSKPFVDHVMGFTVADGKIWVRNYQISEVEKTVKADGDEDEEMADADAKKSKKKAAASRNSKDTDINLVEIGPRFVCTPIIIQEGSFGGPIIYENKQFVSPNQVRADMRRQKAGRHNVRAEQQSDKLTRHDQLGLRTNGETSKKGDALATKAVFA